MAVASSPVEELRSALRGPLLAPDDRGYDFARTTFNALIDRRPAVIARCADRDDVATALGFARHEGLPVAIGVAGTALQDTPCATVGW